MKKALSPKQQKVMKWFQQNQQLTITDAVELIGGDIYRNERFHVGNILGNMVKRGMLTRIKPGVFEATKEQHPTLF